MLEKGIGSTTLEFKISLVRAITLETGRIRAEGPQLWPSRRHGGRPRHRREGPIARARYDDVPHFPELTVSGETVSPMQQSSRSNFVRGALYGLSAAASRSMTKSKTSCGEGEETRAPGVEKGIGSNHKTADALLQQRREGGLQLRVVAGLHDEDGAAASRACP
jgi:hypothetical protein